MIRIATYCLIGVMTVINISLAGCNQTRDGTGVVSPQDQARLDTGLGVPRIVVGAVSPEDQVRLDRLRRWKEYARLRTDTFDREVTEAELAKVEIAIRSYLPAIMTRDQIDKSLAGGTHKIGARRVLWTEVGETWFLGSWCLGPAPGGYIAQLSERVYEGKKESEAFVTTLILLRVDDKLVVKEATQAFVLLRW